MNLDRSKELINRHRLPFAIGGALLISILMTVISMSLYFTSGASRLDFSRPGYEQAREQVKDEKPSQNFNPTGPLNRSVLAEFQKLFDEERATLKSIGNYKDKSMTDESLQLD